MRRVAVAGARVEKFSEKPADPGAAMLEASARLLGSCAIERGRIGAVVCAGGGTYSGAALSEGLGLRPGSSHGVESMCCSGADALVSAYAYVASGLADAALVAGADSSDGPGHVLERDASRGGLSSPLYWGSLMTRAYRRYSGATREQIAAVAAKAHSRARDNPSALPGSAAGARDVLCSRRVSADLRLLECSRPASGGAALLLASEELAGGGAALVRGVGRATAGASFASAGRLDRLESAELASARAYEAARIGPEEVDVAELHDAFAALEAMAAEACGLAPARGGARMLETMHGTGDKKINPRGGLVGSGHPFAATGIAQAAEIYFQVSGTAGRRQVDGARTGLVHTMAAAGTSSSAVVIGI